MTERAFIRDNRDILRPSSALILLYCAFFLYLVVQHSVVFLYHDDWGFAVLDYVVTEDGFEGQDFDLFQAMDFLQGIYNKWSGRVVSMFLNIYAQKAGLWSVRIIQSAVILVAILLAVRIATYVAHANSAVVPAIVAIFAYLAIPPAFFSSGIYWFTASSQYLWGLPVLFAAIYLTLTHRKVTYWSVVLLVVTATFHEQMAFAVNGYLMAFFLMKETHSWSSAKQFLIRVSPVLIVSALTVFAPGNFARKDKSAAFYAAEGIVDVIARNIDQMATLFFWPAQGNVFALWVLAALCAVLLLNVWSSRSDLPDLGRQSVWSAATVGVLTVCYVTDQNVLFAVALIIGYAAALRNLRHRFQGVQDIYPILAAAVASLAPLFYAPTVIERTGIPLMFFEIVVIAYIATVAYQHLPKIARITLLGILVLLGRGSVANAIGLFEGYLENAEIHSFNNCALTVASYKQRNNLEEVREVRLLKLTRPGFSEVMPYERPLIETWMKKYYRLRPEVRFRWE